MSAPFPAILLPPALLDMSTELVPHGRKQLVLEIGLAARAEPLVERRGEDRNGHRLVDGGLDRPPPLARVGNAPFESGKPGILEQRGSGEVEKPRRDHAAHVDVTGLSGNCAAFATDPSALAGMCSRFDKRRAPGATSSAVTGSAAVRRVRSVPVVARVSAPECSYIPSRSLTYFGAALPKESMASCSERRSGYLPWFFSHAARISFISALPT